MIELVSRRPRVIVADDHAEMRRRVAALLASAVDVVATVTDGHEAVEATEALKPDVVVLDMSMPVLNGVQAAVRIRRLSHVPRIVFMTAVDDEAIAAALLSFGGSTLVLKRDILDELIPAVEHAFNTPYTHGVCLYADSAALCRAVTRFIGDGLKADQPALIMATSHHEAEIIGYLADSGIDALERIARGDLAMLNASDLLAQGSPEDMATVFGREVLPIVEELRREGQKFPRIYGEVGGLLWGGGHQAAALRLEEAWNGLDISRKVSVLCGYESEAVGDGAGFRKLCYHHDELVATA